MRRDHRNRAVPWRRPARIWLATAMLGGGLAAGTALAYDDDIDYGAPYITVENGKLVTKDPKQHPATKPGHPSTPPASSTSQAAAGTPASPAAAPQQASPGTGDGQTQRFTPLTVAMLIAGIAILLLLGALIRRGRGRKTPD